MQTFYTYWYRKWLCRSVKQSEIRQFKEYMEDLTTSMRRTILPPRMIYRSRENSLRWACLLSVMKRNGKWFLWSGEAESKRQKKNGGKCGRANENRCKSIKIGRILSAKSGGDIILCKWEPYNGRWRCWVIKRSPVFPSLTQWNTRYVRP